ncbi:hypothetical protein E2C01_067858 [Portunus trituberculatus]|uniref:Uncharacterized protein n=1 Tax=Portunus trituberculatus TaxID=210409 RepID=A0A5B7HUR9_PORTR|nr:hypothetical protein [Portunus trituberculatus]
MNFYAALCLHCNYLKIDHLPHRKNNSQVHSNFILLQDVGPLKFVLKVGWLLMAERQAGGV